MNDLLSNELATLLAPHHKVPLMARHFCLYNQSLLHTISLLDQLYARLFG